MMNNGGWEWCRGSDWGGLPEVGVHLAPWATGPHTSQSWMDPYVPHIV